MPAPISNLRRKTGKTHENPRSLKRKRETEDVDILKRRIQELDTKNGEFASFVDLPLSAATASGLEKSHFKTLTDIQKKAIPLALQGRDILGAAKTGSGKTLAYLVPLLENLYRRRLTEFDGLEALVLSPTRELAIQIFEVLRKVGRNHTFSAGLVIGGKSLEDERERLDRMNILISTPGRMLQHMDQTAGLDVGNLQMLILDEADRIMDMGFQGTVDAIVEHLPQDRQTMLFSATQTKKVSDLARLSLKTPEYVSVHEAAEFATPANLQQNYLVTPLPEKLDVLWSFIKANLKAKMIVFLSSGKQVKFVFESFRRMHPGIPLMHLLGRQKQTTRLETVTKFARNKNACLFATDVVARGLDFPAVDWVIQVDCPEDAATYIHRVGRTARYGKQGRAVLFLDPHEEEGMLKQLSQKRIPIEMIRVRQKKQQSIKNQLQNECFKDQELKQLGQAAFVTYAKSIHLQPDKDVFKFEMLQWAEFAASIGLPGTPNIKFRQGGNAKARKNRPQGLQSSSEDEDGDGVDSKSKAVRTKHDRMFERKVQGVIGESFNRVKEDGLDTSDEEEEDGGFLKVKARTSISTPELSASDPSSSASDTDMPTKTISVPGAPAVLLDSKRREKLATSKKTRMKLLPKGRKFIFDDDGNAHSEILYQNEADFKALGLAEVQREKHLQEGAAQIAEGDMADKELAKNKRREKMAKRKANQAVERGEGAGPGAVLAPFEADDEHAGEINALDGVSSDDGRESPTNKRQKKWFENDKEGGKVKGRNRMQDVENIADLEALATSYLA